MNRRSHFSQARIAFLVLIISTLIYFLAFNYNIFGVADQEWFDTFYLRTQSMIPGRLVKSRQDGLFSAGGMIGRGVLGTENVEWDERPTSVQYDTYINGGEFGNFAPYTSQIGGQAMIFSILDAVLPFPPETKFNLFVTLTSLLTAIVLAAVTRWFYLELGILVALFVLMSIVFSHWLTVFGRNLFWATWGFYLPMLIVMNFLHRNHDLQGRRIWQFAMVVFAATFLKTFLNGYEYISTTLLMTMAPFVFYIVRGKTSFRSIIVSGSSATAAALLAVLLSLVILSFQIGVNQGSFSEGVDSIIYSFQKRTHGNPDELPEEFAESLQAKTTDVLAVYLKGLFFDLHNYLPSPNELISRYIYRVRYLNLILLFAAGSLFTIWDSRRHPSERKSEATALTVTVWFAFLAPISWHVIFKSHSFFHDHINFIVWQMPFTLFGFALMGLIFKNWWYQLSRSGLPES